MAVQVLAGACHGLTMWRDSFITCSEFEFAYSQHKGDNDFDTNILQFPTKHDNWYSFLNNPLPQLVGLGSKIRGFVFPKS